ncbi:MAG: DUF1015 domain-containing protein [Chloroflexi bacterium]|nr:MAG: DUF1015 domain-containing protein [Chloroflexota bacterium]TMG64728.1 MAG: DUF1015 domain-containing protein [Chloroflexota bacterium]
MPGIRYYLARAGDPSKLIAPPYDVIPESEVPRYRSLSPYNVVHLTRPGADYEGAARTFERWLDDRILEPESRSMYVHEVEFDGRMRRDLIASLRLQAYSERVVLPHERTHRGPKEDRLALLRATRVSLEPLWFVYEGSETGIPAMLERVATRAPAVTFTGPEGTDHRLWVISDPAIHASVHSALEYLSVLIADGHHRYETALAYAEEVGGDQDAPTRFTLALLTDLGDPGLVALPTHRVMKAGVAVTGGERKASLEETLGALRGRVAAGAYHNHQFQVLPLEGEVAVVELHEQVIDNILGKREPEEFLLYTRDPAEAVRWVDEGVGVAAFFLDAPDLRQVLKLAQEGKTLPQKATYFHPKPPSGMVFDRLERDRRL